MLVGKGRLRGLEDIEDLYSSEKCSRAFRMLCAGCVYVFRHYVGTGRIAVQIVGSQHEALRLKRAICKR